MKQLFFSILFLTFIGCGQNPPELKIAKSNIILGAENLSFSDLSDKEKEEMIFTGCCCYPNNWNKGVNCVEKEDAFYVKTRIDINLLSSLSESKTFSKDELLTENPHSLYGKYHNRWKFMDENGIEICATSKFDGHNDFGLIRNGMVDELIIGPLPKKPRKMIIEIMDSKHYDGITPEMSLKN